MFRNNNSEDINKKSEINNNELKNTISRYVIHNRKLQNNINQLKIDYPETSLTTVQINEMHNMIINLYERSVFLESHDHEHVTADMEPDKLDLSSHRVVN